VPTVKVGDINMYYEVHGGGQPLLLIMGLGSDSSNWMLQTMEFSKGYQVIVFDNRGVGRTDAPDIPYSVKMMADDTVGLMDAIGVKEAHVLGMSLGGYIAQELGIEYPGRIRSLVLAATAAAPAAYPASAHVVRAWLAALTEGISRRTLLNLQAPFLFTEKLFQMPDLLNMFIEGMAANPYPPLPHGFARQVDACFAHDTRGRLGRIAAPTMVLVGREDVLLPVRLSEELASGIPNARLVVLEGGGHGFNGEIADKFNKAVLDFLSHVT
jgi:3-oxoadipate enol-lactonase